jgi:hypothetical protein
VRIIDIDGIEARVHSEGDAGTMLLLPGAAYPADGPLHWYAGRAAALEGWEVLAVAGLTPDEDVEGWSERLLDALAANAEAGRAVVVAKDRSCAALPGAIGRGIPGVWLTPDLGDPVIASALGGASGLGLVVGATEDGTWDVRVAARIRGFEVFQVGGPDANLEDRHDPHRSLDLLGRLVDRVRALVGRVPA